MLRVHFQALQSSVIVESGKLLKCSLRYKASLFDKNLLRNLGITGLNIVLLSVT